MQPNNLRQALKILGYTNKSLAEEITSFRQDGQRTAEATVSRWVSGASAPDPCLLMYLRERLAQHFIEHHKPRLPQPVNIAVGGGKGGSGASTIALSLAVAAKDLGYRVALIPYNRHCHAQYYLAQKVTDFYIAPVGALDYESGKFDFVFIDLPSAMLIKANLEALSQALDWIDFLLLPVDLCSYFDRCAAIQAFETLDALPSAPAWMSLQCGKHLDLKNFVKEFEQIENWMRLLCARPIVNLEFPVKFVHEHIATWAFAHNDAADCFYRILEEVANRLSISLPDAESLHHDYHLSFDELVEQLMP